MENLMEDCTLVQNEKKKFMINTFSTWENLAGFAAEK